MQRVTTSTNFAGHILSKTNKYTELATGMSVLQHGKWIPASEEIEITADGAQVNHGQHKVHFAANLNTPGAIDLLTPEGHHMTSEPVCLAYFDGTTNVMIAELQDSIGQVLPSLKEALYTNAFSGVQADVVYHYTKASFEQDIILREQLPDPSAFGLNPDHVWLQVWTEFSAAPVPKIARHQTDGDHLDFGIMKMGSGKAFTLAGESNSVPVFKQWGSSRGRTFLIESVPLNAIAAQLQRLPAGSSPEGPNSAPSSGSSPNGDQSKVISRHPWLASGNPPHQILDKMVLPAPKLAGKSSATMRLASSAPVSTGFVLDYTTLNGSLTNYTFQSDTTYYISDDLELYGTTTVEGGTVIKNGTPPNAAFEVNEGFICLTSPYRPAIFTCTNDDSVGDQISGSTGIPAVAQGTTYLYLINSGTVSNVHFRYGWNSFASLAPDMEVWDCQFIDCMNPVTVLDANTNVGLHNVLLTMEDAIDNTDNYVSAPPGGILFNTYSSANLYCEHLTASVQSQNYMSLYVDPSSVTISLTNCIIVSPTLNPPYIDGSPSGATIASTNSVFYSSTLPANLFQTVGAGNYYLGTNSACRNAGTANITPALLADLAQKTTYPPMVFNGGIGAYYWTDQTLYPQAQRETGDAPDLGYHYDPIDYTFGGIFVTNATFTVNPGTVIAALVTNGGGYGLTIGSGAQFLCQGSPTMLCRFVNYNTVQEQCSTNWHTPGYGMLLPNYLDTPPNSVINCRFTDFSILAQDTSHIYCFEGSNGPVNLQDCQFHGGSIITFFPVVNLTNCLVERLYTELYNNDNRIPLIRNSLFYGGIFDFIPDVTNAVVQDNVFFQTSILNDLTGYGYNGGYNAFITNCDRMLPTNSTDLVLTNIAFQTGPLGYYYYPTTSRLINANTNTTADQVGLYHYTTTTNQVKETNSFLDLGYHYVALGTNGLPVDTTGCGTPDYLRDANGNGLVDSGELNWTNAADLGLNVIITRPKNNSIIP